MRCLFCDEEGGPWESPVEGEIMAFVCSYCHTADPENIEERIDFAMEVFFLVPVRGHA